MKLLSGILGGFLGVIIAIFVVIIVIYFGIRKIIGKNQMKILTSMAKNASKNSTNLSLERKSVSGMTSIYEPLILEDFPDFNKELLYQKVESGLMNIFNTIENQKISENKDLELIENLLNEKIYDLKSRKINVMYDDVKFHRHAIKNYQKSSGMATITTSSTVEYYYVCGNDNTYKNIKKQTRYTCSFVYAYDVNLVKENKNIKLNDKVFTTNCPNCGAPFKDIKNKLCEYCGASIEDINMRVWKMVSYSEDYK